MFCDVDTFDWTTYPTDTTFTVNVNTSPMQLPYVLLDTPVCNSPLKTTTVTVSPDVNGFSWLTHDAVNKMLEINSP